jgi:DNA end-binding protein Ku
MSGYSTDMPRAIWSGSIAFGLVNAPVQMYSAIDEHDLELHLVHEKDGSRIGYQKVCKKEGSEVPAEEIVKAYEVDDGELVYLTEEDFEAAEEESYRAIEILDFVPHEQIDPIAFQRTYYLGPAEGAEKVYSLLVRALEAAELSGIARYVFRDREQLGCLRVRDGALILENMYYADEIRPLAEVAPRARKIDPRELELARSLVDRLAGDFDHGKYEDTYRKKLLKVVRRKRRGEEIHAATREDRDAPTDLMAALRASVEASKRGNGGRREKALNGDLEGLTADELRARAADLDIKGRSSMTKKQLVGAIRDSA